jgi:N6-adenosine-specific RNA methylase IME4
MNAPLPTVLPSVPDALRILAQLDAEIERADTYFALDALANRAAGIQRAFKPVKEVADQAGNVWINAECKLDDELRKLPKAKPSGSNQHVKVDRSQKGTDPRLADLGVDKKRAARAAKLNAIPRPKRAAIVTELVAQDKAVTPSAMLAHVRAEAKADKVHRVATAAFSATGPFDCVVIDPPWDTQKIDRDVRPNQDAFPYAVMSYEQIAEFWRKEMVPKLAAGCHVFLWTTQKHLPPALDLIAKLGLRYVLVMVWRKSGGFQPLDLPQYNCEFIVYARHGSPVFIDTKDFNCCFEAPRREHSRKPDAFYDTVRRVTGGSRIDVFSREPREGFSQYGNEVSKFGGNP